MYIDIEEVLWRKIEKQPTRWNEISVNFRGKVGHYRNGSLCYCFSLVGQHLYISSARKFNECQYQNHINILYGLQQQNHINILYGLCNP